MQFTIYNKLDDKVEVIFESIKALNHVDKNLVKAGNVAIGNETKSTQMNWMQIESGRKFDFNMKDLKHFVRGNVKIKYGPWYWRDEKALQHEEGKGMVITSNGELEYCEMENSKEEEKESNNSPPSTVSKSCICLIL